MSGRGCGKTPRACFSLAASLVSSSESPQRERKRKHILLLEYRFALSALFMCVQFAALLKTTTKKPNPKPHTPLPFYQEGFATSFTSNCILQRWCAFNLLHRITCTSELSAAAVCDTALPKCCHNSNHRPYRLWTLLQKVAGQGTRGCRY